MIVAFFLDIPDDDLVYQAVEKVSDANFPYCWYDVTGIFPTLEDVEIHYENK